MFDRPLSAVPSSSSSSGYPPLNHQPKLAPQSPSKPMAYYNLQVIQLVECSPPQRRIAAIASPSFASSSSYSSSCSSASEEAVSSYCSSDEDDHVVERQHGEISRATLGDCYSLRMKRIQSWRDNFFASLTSTARGGWPSQLSLKRLFSWYNVTDTSKSSPPALKRKLPPTDTEDDTVSTSQVKFYVSKLSLTFHSHRSLRSALVRMLLHTLAPLAMCPSPQGMLCPIMAETLEPVMPAAQPSPMLWSRKETLTIGLHP
ncbi:hypothetical protein BDV98DRAFT_280118 [Pterulicium gracile]|uniref:Uncharacterized protein n=1 Tax=Pterulicium gracile TaxID=1884261 RepID=A0A5C3QSW7_9AGAR|nr:hypothetical protein BDV98DRAFT_280118 [Pterula gracilis]